jgi:hypothetical protein
MWRDGCWVRVAAVVAGLAAVTVHLLPGLQAPGAHCPLRDVHVYWRGGQQPALGGPPYAPGAPYSFTDPPLAAAVAAGAALLPSQFRVFWLDGVFADRSRIGNPGNPSDQSLAGAMARLAGGAAAVQPWWLAEVLLTGVAGLAVAAWAHRRGHRLAGVTCCAITGVLISPFSWTHWAWAVPMLVMLITAARRRRSPACGLAAAAAVFSGLIPLPSPGHHPGLGRLLASDLYVLCGLAVLAGAALALTRERAAARAGVDRNRGLSPPMRWLVT